MVPLILLLTAVIFQVTTNWIVLSDEVTRNAYNDEYYDMGRLAKRYLGALAKNKQLPTGLSVQERSLPPMVSPYAQKAYASYGGIGVGVGVGAAEEPEIVESKRYLGSLARSGDLNFSKPQQKKNTGELESEEPADEYIQNKGYTDELPNFTVLKLELIDSLKPILLEYIEQQKKDYDPSKVNLFLENLANAVFDKNEEFSLDNIKTLVKSDYFQPEAERNKDRSWDSIASAITVANKELHKRNIQSLVRDFNVSFGGSHRRASRNFRDAQIDLIKRNLESVIKNKMYEKRNVGAMAKNDAFPHSQPGKRYYSGFGSDLEEYLKTLQAKRHTMYDINEPDLTVEYPSQAADQNDYTDYAEQLGQDAAIPIGKRYIGALARSGWLPRGFAERSNRMSSSFEAKRHIGALAKLGWLSSVHDSPTYYYRGGRGRDFKPPSFRGPRAYFLKADSDLGRCQCKRSSETRPASHDWLADPRNEKTIDWTTSEIMKSAKPSTTSLSEKNYFLIPIFDRLIFRTLYPNLQG